MNGYERRKLRALAATASEERERAEMRALYERLRGVAGMLAVGFGAVVPAATKTTASLRALGEALDSPTP
jgi:hypothetical protein